MQLERLARAVLIAVSLVLAGCAATAVRAPAVDAADRRPYRLSTEDDAFLEDLSRRSFLFFWEQADAGTGIIRDRAGTDGSPSANESAREVGSIASIGFGLSGMCIAAERGWRPRQEVIERTRRTLRFFAGGIGQEHGWFYHFVNLHTGAREWKSELSSIDTALFLAGVLTVRQCFDGDPEVPRLADAIYRRVDFQWMLAGDPMLLSHGWKPEEGFLEGRWDHYCELMILYLLAIGSPTHAIPAGSWYAWSRPTMTFEGFRYVSGADPLFVHQYAHAWVDFRGWRDDPPPHVDWFENSVIATRAHKAFCLSLSAEFSSYSQDVWGITASDSRKGYVAWGGPPRHEAIDGSVVPAAAAGSLMFAPDITLRALREMRRRFGDRIYGRYGFADAFHPTAGWVNPDVIGIDLGITLLSAENLRTGQVWTWFMRNQEIRAAMEGARRATADPTGDRLEVTDTQGTSSSSSRSSRRERTKHHTETRRHGAARGCPTGPDPPRPAFRPAVEGCVRSVGRATRDQTWLVPPVSRTLPPREARLGGSPLRYTAAIVPVRLRVPVSPCEARPVTSVAPGAPDRAHYCGLLWRVNVTTAPPGT